MKFPVIQKFAILSLALLSLLGKPGTALAAAGGTGSSGGGDILAEQFVALSRDLLAQVDFSSSQRAVLEKALAESQFVSRPVLLDPTSNAPIGDQQELLAWSSPGLVQLKQETFTKALENRAPIAQYLFHELYRAAGLVDASGRSPDDGFQISVGQLHLDKIQLLTGQNMKSLACQIWILHTADQGGHTADPLPGSKTVTAFAGDNDVATTKLDLGDVNYGITLWRNADKTQNFARVILQSPKLHSATTQTGIALPQSLVRQTLSTPAPADKPFRSVTDGYELVCDPQY
jgi:hypothetical protein